MLNYIARRLFLMIPTLLGITFLIFMMVATAGGGIGAAVRAAGGNLQSQSGVAVQQAYLEDRYGLDDPVVMQYFRWLGRLSPVKIGPRDLVSPSGDLIGYPKELKAPPLWKWFADSLPPAPKPGPATEFKSDEEQIRAFRAALRSAADARADLVAQSALLREALKDYVVEAEIPAAKDRDGKVRLAKVEPTAANKTVPSWPKVEKFGKAAVDAFERAQAERAKLITVFDTRPYPAAGVGIGPVSLTRPDLGSAFSRNRPVIDLIEEKLPITLMLNIVAFPIIYLIAIPSGMLAAIRRGTWLDSGLGVLFIGLWSVPIVLAGILAIGYLASKDELHWFPVGGLHHQAADTYTFLPTRTEAGWQPGYLLDSLWHLTLPVLCLVYGGFAVLSKQTRAAMLDNFNADYVRTAKAKGVAPGDIVFRHVFRNSLLPLITMFVSIFPAMLAGSVVIERVFSIPGMGSLIIEAINLRDRELILANATMIAAVNILALLLADILYAIADPRISYK
jgi:ABC-type dipeptide/oligopeptide/nickel transport system permease component